MDYPHLQKLANAYPITKIPIKDRSKDRMRYAINNEDGEIARAILREAEKNPELFTYLRELYVAPKYRGRGLSKLLIQAIREDAPEKRVVLRPHPFKDKPLNKKQLTALYTHLGAKPYEGVPDRLTFDPLVNKQYELSPSPKTRSSI